MSRKFIIIGLLSCAFIVRGYAQRIDFEYNEFGERVLLLSSLPEPVAVDEEISPYKMRNESNVISLHPNPVSDYLEIQLNEGIFVITLSDISGKKLFVQPDVSGLVKIPFTDYKSGIYILNVCGVTKTETHKIVKN